MKPKASNKILRSIVFSYLYFLTVSAYAGSHYTPYYIEGSEGQMKYGAKVFYSIEFAPWAGGYFEYRLLDYFAIETGLYYACIRDGLVPKDSAINEMKKRGQSTVQTAVYSFNTIYIPLIARFYPGQVKQMSLFFGVSVNALLSAKRKTIDYHLTSSSKKSELLISTELSQNPFSDKYQDIDKGELNPHDTPLLNSIAWYTLFGWTYETKFGLIFGNYLVMKLSSPFINYDKSKFKLSSAFSYFDSLKFMLGYNVASLIYPEQYRTDDHDTNIIPKYLKPYQEASYFVDHFIKFGLMAGQNLYAGSYGAFIEYKPVDRIGVSVALNWGYMSYGVMPSEEDITIIESGDNKNYRAIPVNLIGIKCLSIPLIIKTYFSGKQFAPFFGIRLSVLTSAKTGVDYYLDTETSRDALLGISVSKKYFEIEKEIEGSDDSNLKQIIEIKDFWTNRNGKPTLNQMQIASIVGFEYETEDGFIWGMKYDMPLSSFINLVGFEREGFSSLQEVGNWTIMGEVGYNFSSLFHYYAIM